MNWIKGFFISIKLKDVLCVALKKRSQEADGTERESTIIPDRRQSETLIPSTNVDQKSFEKVFSIAICRQSGDK